MTDWLILIAQCFFHLIAIIVHRVSPEILYIFYSFKVWGHLGNSNSKPKDPNTSYRSKKAVYFLCAPGTSFLRWYPVAPFFAPGKKNKFSWPNSKSPQKGLGRCWWVQPPVGLPFQPLSLLSFGGPHDHCESGECHYLHRSGSAGSPCGNATAWSRGGGRYLFWGPRCLKKLGLRNRGEVHRSWLKMTRWGWLRRWRGWWIWWEVWRHWQGRFIGSELWLGAVSNLKKSVWNRRIQITDASRSHHLLQRWAETVCKQVYLIRQTLGFTWLLSGCNLV